jgi:hypothetical protein
MKIGMVKQIVKEELSKFEKLPQWIDPLIQTLNTFITNTVLALNGRLTFRDNFLCTIKSIKITHSVESQINPDSANKVSGVLVLSAGGLPIDTFGWRQLSNGNIGVSINYGSGTQATCLILILFE